MLGHGGAGSAVVIYSISEVFLSVQGEGAHTGTPSAFVRLYGCSVGCPWCDSAYTWKLPPAKATFGDLLYSEPEQALVAEVDVETLAAWCDQQPADHVVLTGGEPLEQDLAPLLERFAQLGQFVQVETSGTVRPSDDTLSLIDWLTVSPKIDMPGGLAVQTEMLHRADEIKMPVGRERDIAQLQSLLNTLRAHPPVWLQPLSQSAKATRLCIEAAAANGWRVSLQTHKGTWLR